MQIAGAVPGIPGRPRAGAKGDLGACALGEVSAKLINARPPRPPMKPRIARTVLQHEGNASLASAALEMRLGGRPLEFPALGATYADYGHARKAGANLDADVFAYYHLDYKRPISKREARDNVAERIERTQERHRPRLTIVHMLQDGSLTGTSLRAFHEFQRDLGLQVVTTTEKDPLQGMDAFRKEMEGFEAFETDQAKAPTVSMRCDPEHLEAKLLYVARRHKIVNVQWGGHAKHAAGWEVLARASRANDLLCNVIGVPRRYETVGPAGGQQVRPSAAITPLLYGAHLSSVMPQSYPRAEGAARAGGTQGTVMGFDPDTWCYEASGLEPDRAHAGSFNAAQRALGLARSSILDGSFYSSVCGRVLGPRVCLERAMALSAASRDPGQARID